MTEALITLLINAIATPIFVLLTMYLKSNIRKEERDARIHDGFISGLEKRIAALEKEVRELRQELKNRDAEYLELYKEHTTLKAKYEVLQVDYEELKVLQERTAKELESLRLELKTKAEEAARALGHMNV